MKSDECWAGGFAQRRNDRRNPAFVRDFSRIETTAGQTQDRDCRCDCCPSCCWYWDPWRRNCLWWHDCRSSREFLPASIRIPLARHQTSRFTEEVTYHSYILSILNVLWKHPRRTSSPETGKKFNLYPLRALPKSVNAGTLTSLRWDIPRDRTVARSSLAR